MAAASWTMAYLLLVASAGPADTFYTNLRNFQIPIDINDARRAEIKEVVLYLATPDGKWEPMGRVGPQKGAFPFRAQADGDYIFKLAFVNSRTHRQEPEDIARDGVPNHIVVDTVKPELRLRSAERQGDTLVVRWELVEKYPDWTTFQLEYLAAEGGPWARLDVPQPESGQATVPVSGPAVAVRASVMDLAKNKSDPASWPSRTAARARRPPRGTPAARPAPACRRWRERGRRRRRWTRTWRRAGRRRWRWGRLPRWSCRGRGRAPAPTGRSPAGRAGRPSSPRAAAPPPCRRPPDRGRRPGRCRRCRWSASGTSASITR
jgi:hypothetical protein